MKKETIQVFKDGSAVWKKIIANIHVLRIISEIWELFMEFYR